MNHPLQIDLHKQPYRTTLLVAYALAMVAIAGVIILSVTHDRSIQHLTQDVALYHGDSFYIGILSSLGLFLWAAAAGICLFGATVTRACGPDRSETSFLTCSGLFTLALLIDDAFLLHSRLLPNHLNMSAMTVYAIYGLVLAVFTLWFGRLILATHYPLLLLAIGLLGMSVVVESLLSQSEFTSFIADILKFLGSVGWLTYFINTAAAVIPGSKGLT